MKQKAKIHFIELLNKSYLFVGKCEASLLYIIFINYKEEANETVCR